MKNVSLSSKLWGHTAQLLCFLGTAAAATTSAAIEAAYDAEVGGLSSGSGIEESGAIKRHGSEFWPTILLASGPVGFFLLSCGFLMYRNRIKRRHEAQAPRDDSNVEACIEEAVDGSQDIDSQYISTGSDDDEMGRAALSRRPTLYDLDDKTKNNGLPPYDALYPAGAYSDGLPTYSDACATEAYNNHKSISVDIGSDARSADVNMDDEAPLLLNDCVASAITVRTSSINLPM